MRGRQQLGGVDRSIKWKRQQVGVLSEESLKGSSLVPQLRPCDEQKNLLTAIFSELLGHLSDYNIRILRRSSLQIPLWTYSYISTLLAIKWNVTYSPCRVTNVHQQLFVFLQRPLQWQITRQKLFLSKQNKIKCRRKTPNSCTSPWSWPKITSLFIMPTCGW